jgi:hypothetical protein
MLPLTRRNTRKNTVKQGNGKACASGGRDNGTWANLKTPLRLVILTILAFLFASRQEEYSRVITYITAFGAGIPAVMKVFSIFGGAGGQKTD